MPAAKILTKKKISNLTLGMMKAVAQRIMGNLKMRDQSLSFRVDLLLCLYATQLKLIVLPCHLFLGGAWPNSSNPSLHLNFEITPSCSIRLLMLLLTGPRGSRVGVTGLTSPSPASEHVTVRYYAVCDFAGLAYQHFTWCHH